MKSLTQLVLGLDIVSILSLGTDDPRTRIFRRALVNHYNTKKCLHGEGEINHLLGGEHVIDWDVPEVIISDDLDHRLQSIIVQVCRGSKVTEYRITKGLAMLLEYGLLCENTRVSNELIRSLVCELVDLDGI